MSESNFQYTSLGHGLSLHCYWTGLGVPSGGLWVKKCLAFLANVVRVWDLPL